jgi:hypothetical protein
MLPQVALPEIYSFLSVKDLAKLRAVSTSFRSEVDRLGISNKKKKLFIKLPKPVLCGIDHHDCWLL